MIIAIDGPAGSGKSSTAREVAARLGFVYVDTGAMYRALALAFLRAGTPFEESRCAEALDGARLRVVVTEDGLAVLLGDQDVSGRIRDPEVSSAASEVSRLGPVREYLVAEQRRIARSELARGRGVVMEGRDIGTVVFPDARLKVFLTADSEERARRRAGDYKRTGRAVSDDALRRDLSERDERDARRDLSPLRAASDAVHLDTTLLTFEEQVERIVALARERGA